jgi:hypothetical protein
MALWRLLHVVVILRGVGEVLKRGGNRFSAMVATWENGSWTLRSTPRKADALDNLVAGDLLGNVSCVPGALASFGCKAVGDAFESKEGPLIDTFRTRLPQVTAQGSTGVATGEATLTGTVNPEGSATNYQFQYGKTTSYGQAIPPVPKASALVSKASTSARRSKGWSPTPPTISDSRRSTKAALSLAKTKPSRPLISSPLQPTSPASAPKEPNRGR